MASGDVITAIDGEPVRDGNDLRAKISDVKPGETVPVTVLRREEETELSVTVEELTPERLAAESGGRPATAAPVEAMETFGIEVTNLPPALRMKTGRPDAVSGVAVASVSPSVTDDRTLLKADDIIVRMKIEGGDLRDILTVNQFKADAARAKKGRPVLLLVARGGESFFISFKTP
jgi:serine protease Do